MIFELNNTKQSVDISLMVNEKLLGYFHTYDFSCYQEARGLYLNDILSLTLVPLPSNKGSLEPFDKYTYKISISSILGMNHFTSSPIGNSNTTVERINIFYDNFIFRVKHLEKASNILDLISSFDNCLLDGNGEHISKTFYVWEDYGKWLMLNEEGQ